MKILACYSFRDFDVFLSRMCDSRSRLKKSLRAVQAGYGVILPDCPPDTSLLPQNVFRAADAILVPVLPTTLVRAGSLFWPSLLHS